MSLLELSACIPKSVFTGELEGARRGRSRQANLTVTNGTAISLFPAFPRGSYRKERLESSKGKKWEEGCSLAAVTGLEEQHTDGLWHWFQAWQPGQMRLSRRSIPGLTPPGSQILWVQSFLATRLGLAQLLSSTSLSRCL